MQHIDGIYRKPFLLDERSGTEWIETNGIGAYASSTLIERNDRKYHGLLITPLQGVEGRYHILSAIDAIVRADVEIPTGTTRYPDTDYPQGWKNLEKMKILPVRQWVYGTGEAGIRKEVLMCKDEPAVYVIFTRQKGGEGELILDLKFLFTYRDVHGLTRANEYINTELYKEDNFLRLSPYEGMPSSDISFSGDWSQNGELYWDYNICYESEKRRGLEWVEDRFVPGNISIKLSGKAPFVIRVGITDEKTRSPEQLVEACGNEISERNSHFQRPKNGTELLKLQSSHFILRNPSGRNSINAGYPWFGEWGRDTMIALPGLTFYSGNLKLGEKILEDYISMIKDGLLPNTLGDTQGFTSYNSIDAGLLFCWAVGKMIDFGYGSENKEKQKLTEIFFPAMSQIVTAFLENRVPSAGLDDKGLLYSGSPDTQLTWMDATAWGRPVTPRYGYAVELNSLWYGALCLYKKLAGPAGTTVDKKIINLIESFPKVFRDMFWVDEGYLSDTVNDNGPDRKIRPNMLFASASDEGLLTMAQRRSVTETAEKYLLTDLGLRTLAPSDSDFQPVYAGGADERDSRYHQGTVWPWLLGIMIESSIKTAGDIEQKAIFWSDYLENLFSVHLTSKGWGFISEVFDGLVPREGKGCFAQAWSCGEIIRASEIIKRVELDGRNKEG